MNKHLLIEKSKEVRKDIINMIYESKSGHPEGSLSYENGEVSNLILLHYIL